MLALALLLVSRHISCGWQVFLQQREAERHRAQPAGRVRGAAIHVYWLLLSDYACATAPLAPSHCHYYSATIIIIVIVIVILSYFCDIFIIIIMALFY